MGISDNRMGKLLHNVAFSRDLGAQQVIAQLDKRPV